MNNISSSLDLPVKFIRYNPDNKVFKKEEKEETLLKTIQELMGLKFCDNLDPIYLFY